MGLLSSIFGKKTSSKTAQTTTTTPNAPTWATDGASALSGSVLGMLGKDPTSFFAGPDPLQTQAAQGAAGLTNSPYFGQAGSMFQQAGSAPANTYGASTYKPTTYGAGSYQGQGYDPTTYQGQGYTANNYTGQGYNAEGYNAAQGTAQGYNAQTGKASSLLDNLGAYMSPYTGQVVDAALSDYDYGAGQTLAQQKLDERRNGAFGDSGLAITRSQTSDALTRGRGSLSAGLRDQAFNTGANLSNLDAGRRQEMDVTNLGALNNASQFNTNAQNVQGLANQTATNNASEFNTGARNNANQFNANATNNANQFNAGANNDASSFLANALNTSGQFNAGAKNDANSFFANANNAANQFNTGAANTANQFNAGATNDAGSFNANANNTANQFNAGQQESMLKRILDSASGMSNLGVAQGNDTRQNIGLQGQLGAALQALAQQQAGAPIDILSQLSSVFGSLPVGALTGSTSTGTGTGTSTTTDIAGTVAKIAQAAAMFSDARLKEDIQTSRYDDKGRRWVTYNYIWDPEVRHEGLVAQEAMLTDPEAVMLHPNGFLMIDYSKIGG